MAEKQNEKNSSIESKWLENDLCKSVDLTLPVSILNDYRRIPLYPTVEDMKGNVQKISLRPNHTYNPYQNCDDYLDTFFRLMREDFISVVRNTLNEVVSKLQNNILVTKNVWYFNNVQIVHYKKSSETMFFQFDSRDNAKIIDYENSNKFKNGALLLLSNNKFVDFTLGIVTDTLKLNKGVVGVDVVDFNKIMNWSSIDLLEPQVFYEPFRYVLAVFQDMNESNFPMKKYIVYGNQNVSFPSYLRQNSIYTINGITFDILNHTQWPSARLLHMDINQYEAFKGALTKEFAMIQGPPGTGKTYIGLEIVKIIIENMYRTKILKNPILVVCMTNHALDKFLEGIWNITNNISRFGRGTSSDILVNYVPTMKISRKDKCTDIYVEARRNISTVLREENEHVSNVADVEQNIGILDFSCLYEVLFFKNIENWFQNSYDVVSWLLSEIPSVNGTNPIDFIKTRQLLSPQLPNKTGEPIKNDLYCISLNSIQVYSMQVLYQLDTLSENFCESYVLKKKNLELELKIIKAIEDYMIKHFKLCMSNSYIECNSQIDRNSLSARDRWLLYYNWVGLYLKQENMIIECLKDSNRQNKRDLNKVKSIGFLSCVKTKFVVGMTTTAAARSRYLLTNLKCPIVIIEEAAEVLEPHIVASLSKYCEHLILIGDHKQLRPQTANHQSNKNNLNISLFERMVNNKIPSYILSEQHRMRPEIAGLVAPAIYPHLINHPSVKEKPHVRGVGMNVFCLTSCAYEEKDDELSSYVNSSEATFLVELAKYLLKQRYYPEEITILTTYNAQLAYISKLINSSQCDKLKAIRLSSVDGYQGEENEIVLLSLVRSNVENSIGFLRNNNRVCVALSRARIGFYITGNLDLLAQASNLWKSVKLHLQKLNALGPKLMLKCGTHGNFLGGVSNKLDFESLDSCELMCNSEMCKLSCGHLSNKVFYAEDHGQLSIKCSYPCEKKCLNGHKCKKICYEDCISCEVKISKLGFCGHVIEGKCCDIDKLMCQIRVKETLKCGHTTERECHTPSVCQQKCEKLNSNCIFRHLCQRQCGLPCGPCIKLIPVLMHCGHRTMVYCSSNMNLIPKLCEKCSFQISPSLTYPQMDEEML